MPDNHDLVIVGLGVGGSTVALQAAEHGMDVLAVEQSLVGGECPYWGCVPSKAMTRAVQLIGEVRRATALAGASDVQPAWKTLADRVASVSENWDDAAAATQLQGAGVELERGRARVVGPCEIEVDGRRFAGRRGLLIATGTQPAIPPIPGLADVPFWTNHEAIETNALPESLIVIGGGAVGLELAQTFHRFGAAVTIVEAQPHVLPGEEPENTAAMEEALRRDGVNVRTSTSVESVDRSDDEIVVRLDSGETLSAQRLLVATGRRPDLHSLGVGTIGLDEQSASIPTDERLRAGEKTWAIGDVTGHGAFTHVAYYQAQIAAADILGLEHAAADYSAVPRVTYTDPEIGGVGLTEAQARAQGLDVRVATLPVESSDRGWLYGEGADLGNIKVVVDKATGAMIGGSVVCPGAGELIALLAVAISARIPVDTLMEVIYPYPTFARGLRGALRRLR